MKKIIISILMIILMLSITAAASDKPKEKSDIGRIDFIHYAKENNGKAAKTETCYKLIGVKWLTTPVNYVINPANDDGLTEEFVTNAISTSANTWDAATSKQLFGSYVTDPAAYYGTRDYKNAISFGDYSNSGVIAVTSVWYIKSTKQIVEFDMLFNTDFVWGDATINPALMDLENIATHELGHSVGLADLYSTSCTEVTMYGYSNNGDVAKRTLEQPDITGLQKMYGI